MATDLVFSCQCGAFKASIDGATPDNCNHAVCYCTDCQAGAHHLGAERTLDAQGGSDLVQIQPFRIQITQGKDKLAVFQLAPKGLYRWHTTCCKTPVCNTLGTPKFSFAGFTAMHLSAGAEVVGPILVRYKTDQATAHVTDHTGSLPRFVFRTLRNVAKARLSGRWKQNPFFGPDGRAIVKPYVLSEAERAAAYAT